MTDTPPPVILKQNIYCTVYIGNGDLTDDIKGAKLGYFYVDATDGSVQCYDGSSWNDVTGNVTITV